MRPAILVLAMLATLGAGCATPPPDAKPAASGLAELMDRTAERALVEGIRLYEEGQYPAAEAALKRALAAGLTSARDRATAHKLIAFVACTSAREAECEAAFRAARSADPAFELAKAEAGHPMWGPVYRRVATP